MLILDSGSVSVGRAVTSHTRDPQFESQHRQTLSTNLIRKEKEAGNGLSLKNKLKVNPNKPRLQTTETLSKHLGLLLSSNSMKPIYKLSVVKFTAAK